MSISESLTVSDVADGLLRIVNDHFGYVPMGAGDVCARIAHAFMDDEGVPEAGDLLDVASDYLEWNVGTEPAAVAAAVEAARWLADLDRSHLGVLRSESFEPDPFPADLAASVRTVLGDAVRGGMLREDDAATLLRRMGLGMVWAVEFTIEGFEGTADDLATVVESLGRASGYVLTVQRVAKVQGSLT